jgi:hypothetical protein
MRFIPKEEDLYFWEFQDQLARRSLSVFPLF